MARDSGNQTVESYLSTRAPLEKKETFKDSSWFKLLLFFFGIYFILVLYVLNNYLEPDGESLNESSNSDDFWSNYISFLRIYSASINHIENSNFYKILITSVVSTIFLVIACRLFTKAFIKFSIVIFYIAYFIGLAAFFIMFIVRISGDELDQFKSEKLKVNYSEFGLLIRFIFAACIGYSIHFALKRVELNEIVQVIQESYKVVIEFWLAIVFFSLFTYLSIMVVKLGLFVTIELADIWKSSQEKLLLFSSLQIFNAIMTSWLLNFLFNFQIMTLSKMYSTWYWVEDKTSIAPFEITLKALWTTFRYDMGIITHGIVPWSVIPILTTIWKNATRKMSSFKKLPLVFKLVFCLDSLMKVPWCGLCVGASHNSGFLQSTKIAGYFNFEKAIKFFAVGSVLLFIEGFRSALWAIIVVFVHYIVADVQKPDKFYETLTTYEQVLIQMLSLTFTTSMYTCTVTFLLCSSESSERSDQHKSKNLSYEFNVESQQMEQNFNTRL